MGTRCQSLVLFFVNDTATTEIYTLSLHDALPISSGIAPRSSTPSTQRPTSSPSASGDRKSTRLNSSHGSISHAVFCLKKPNQFSQCPDGQSQHSQPCQGAACIPA